MAAEPGPDFRWGLVLRRSTYNLDGTEGSTRRQELALARHIKNTNMGRVVGVYKDVASAYREGTRRPEYDAALIDLRAGRIDGIAVWRIDRLCRRAKQYRYVLDVLEQSGGRLFSLVEGIDTAAEGVSKATTNMVLAILVELAEMEAEAMASRQRLMHEDRARSGLVQRSGVRPFGHTVDWTALVPHEVDLIHEAAKRILAGEGYGAIANDWTRRGIPTATGKTVWQHSTVRQILLSPRLVGKHQYGADLVDYNDVPPILELNTWERVRDVLEARRHQTGRRERRLVSNIAVCGICGSPIIGGSEGDGRLSYNCRKRPKVPGACGGINITAKYVDDLVGEQVAEFLADRARVATLLREHDSGPGFEALHQREQELSDNLLALDQALKPPRGVLRMPIDRYYAVVTEIEAERREIHRRMAVSREASLLVETLDFGGQGAEVWQDRPITWKRAILRLVTERIEIHRATQHGRPGLHGTEFDPERVKIKFAA